MTNNEDSLKWKYYLEKKIDKPNNVTFWCNTLRAT